MTTFDTCKDPDSVVDYTIDWTTALNGDTISTSSWTADSGITVDSDTNTTTGATVWVSGGTVYEYANVINQVVSAGGRTMERTIVVAIQPR